MTPGKMFWRWSVWVGHFVPETVSNTFPRFKLSPVFACFTGLICHLGFWTGGGWAEMTLADDTKVLQTRRQGKVITAFGNQRLRWENCKSERSGIDFSK